MQRSSSVRVAVALYLGAALLAVVAGFFWGFRSAPDRDPTAEDAHGSGQRFRVEGDSMMPTLQAGQIVRLRASDTHRRGDVVVVRWQGKRRVKRIAAIGGDVVDRADGRLRVNGRRLEELLAERDPSEFLPPAAVPVAGTADDWTPIDGQPGWSLFTYHNPHEGGRATAVMDDYPTNVDVSRRLHPVDRLAVSLDPGQDVARWEGTPVAFFDDESFAADSILVAPLRAGRVHRGRADRRPVVGSAVPAGVAQRMGAAHPIAIALDAETLRRLRPRIWRDVEYRDDRRHDGIDYPITLKPGEVFVLGDNVPVSVDSRHDGPLSRDDILGRVVPDRAARRQVPVASP